MARRAQQAILLQDVEKLGRKGDVVQVAAGHLRNYLAPRKLAEACDRRARRRGAAPGRSARAARGAER